MPIVFICSETNQKSRQLIKRANLGNKFIFSLRVINQISNNNNIPIHVERPQSHRLCLTIYFICQ